MVPKTMQIGVADEHADNYEMLTDGDQEMIELVFPFRKNVAAAFLWDFQIEVGNVFDKIVKRILWKLCFDRSCLAVCVLLLPLDNCCY